MARWEYRVMYRRAHNRYPQYRVFGLWPKAKGYIEGLMEMRYDDELPVTEIVVARREVGQWENTSRWTRNGGDQPVVTPGVINLKDFC